MQDFFEIPLTYKEKDISFPATLITTGSTYKIQVDVFGKLVNFELDEERNFRAVINMDELDNAAGLDKQLLQQIAATLEAILR